MSGPARHASPVISRLPPRFARARVRGGIMSLAAWASLCISCEFIQADPVHDQEVAALGPERPGVPQGPYHRAGQPCTVCHSSGGPAQQVFSIAGTVFSSRSTSPSQPNLIGVNQASVGIVDDNGGEFVVPTKCVGNFYVTPDLFNPAFPIRVNVSKEGAGVVPMIGHIGRDSSCASCHADPPSVSSPGHVYLPTTAPTSDPSCPVSPVLGGG
jgi:hypothetical protein